MIRCSDCDKILFKDEELENKEKAWNELYFYFKFQYNQGYITNETFEQLVYALVRLDHKSYA